jgi:hypothetical protein
MLNRHISAKFEWDPSEQVIWLSPVASDEYAEYSDQNFLDRLGVRQLKVPLHDFWPPGGPRWDGLAKTLSGKLTLVEAKAHIDEAVDYCSRASPEPLKVIQRALRDTKRAFAASKDAPWESPFYEHANRLAHLYFMRQLNGLDAYLLFLYFADASDAPNPCSVEQWEGAIRLKEKCLGLGNRHPFRCYVGALLLSVPELLAGGRIQTIPGSRERYGDHVSGTED